MRAGCGARCGAVAPLPLRTAAPAPPSRVAATRALPPLPLPAPALRPHRPRRGCAAAAWVDDLGVIFGWQGDAPEGYALRKDT